MQIIQVKVRKPDSDEFVFRTYKATNENWHVACADARDYGTEAHWLCFSSHTGIVDILETFKG